VPVLRAVCFDLFHTLLDVGDVPASVGRFTADILGLDRRAWNDACFGAAHEIRRPTEHRQVIRALAHSLDPTLPERLIDEAVAERQARFDHSLLHVAEEVLEGLQALREAGLGLALVSNASTAEVAAWERSPLAPLFDAALFSCRCGHAKPEPAIYRLALDALGVAPEEALFVGDGGSDEHAGAAAVGLHPVLITRHFGKTLPAERLAERRARVRWEVADVPGVAMLVAALASGEPD